MKRRGTIQQIADTLGGIAVFGCIPGSPAERAGVLYGDIILAVDGRPVTTHIDYVERIRHSGDHLTILVFREGDEVEVELDMTERVDMESDEVAEYLAEQGATY